MVVDPLAGPMMYGVMTKTTMLLATGMVELVASMITKDMIVTARYGTFSLLILTYNTLTFDTFIGL